MDDFRDIYEKYFNNIWHICLAYMKNTSEAEDALQETFLRYIKYCKKKRNAFSSEDDGLRYKKIRAWLFITAGNVCKDQLKSWWRKREAIDDYDLAAESNPYETDEVLEVLMNMPDEYKIPVYMYYYLGYNSNEIAEELKMAKSTIRSRLSRARKLLKKEIEKGGYIL